MGSVVIAGSTSGTVTITPPAEAGTRTITLPAATGTAVLEDGSNNLQMNSGFGSSATAYGCRAWVSFNGTGTVAILNSGNVSSITDNATGKYTVNFATAMPDDDYSVSGTVQDTTSGAGSNSPSVTIQDATSSITTSTLIINVVTGNGSTFLDSPFVSVQIVR